jgi:hypothetical protein
MVITFFSKDFDGKFYLQKCFREPVVGANRGLLAG